MNEPEEIICTLYEGDFHNGVAALANSLQKSGFRGALLVGYRGELPDWCKPLRDSSINDKLTVRTLEVQSLRIHFTRVDTDYHLTNFKPDFMLIAAELFPAAKSFYYFDPDIVLTTEWSFYQTWIDFGVALCEDINSPIGKNHPQRMTWRRYFREHGYTLTSRGSSYVNGGFIGLRRDKLDFVEQWKGIQKAMAPAIGGLSRSSIGKNSTPRPEIRDPVYAFWKTDQDALNATVESYHEECSIIGKEAMAFKQGDKIMAHAQGRYKPWSKAYVHATFSGRPPSIAEKEYWKHVSQPIPLVSPLKLMLKKLTLGMCSFIGRFYHR